MDASIPQVPVGLLASRLLRDFEAQLAACLADLGHPGLRVRQATVLGTLAGGGQRITALASEAKLTAQAMGEVIDELERSGYVARSDDPIDRRAKIVTLTERGEKAVVDCLQVVGDVEQSYARLLEPGQFEAVRSALTTLVARIDGT